MRKALAASCLGLAALAATLVPAAADKRVALVIGNSAYQHAPSLTNPGNDAGDMAAKLRGLDFQVVDGIDLGAASGGSWPLFDGPFSMAPIRAPQKALSRPRKPRQGQQNHWHKRR